MAMKKMVLLNGEWVEQKGDKQLIVKPESSTTSKWGDGKSNYSSSTPYLGSWGGTYGGYQQCKKHTWEPVYDWMGIHVYGSAKSDIPDLEDGDKTTKRLIVNCTGYSVNSSSKPFVAHTPPGLVDLANSKYQVKLKCADELLLDWSDGGAPLVYPQFWADMSKQIEKAGYTEVVFCCMGGHGRTGTALVCFGLANGVYADPDNAIGTVRKVHCKKAVESYQQIDYVEWLATKLLGWKSKAKDGHCDSKPSK